jgi:hypothetical protein
MFSFVYIRPILMCIAEVMHSALKISIIFALCVYAQKACKKQWCVLMVMVSHSLVRGVNRGTRNKQTNILSACMYVTSALTLKTRWGIKQYIFHILCVRACVYIYVYFNNDQFNIQLKHKLISRSNLVPGFHSHPHHNLIYWTFYCWCYASSVP